MDRRIIKTKKSLVKALLKLLNTKPLASITVMDLCEESNINRGTFYRHYIDKNDFIEKCDQEVFKCLYDFGVVFQMNPKKQLELINNLKTSYYDEHFYRLLVGIQQHGDYIRARLTNFGDLSFFFKVKHVFNNIFSADYKYKNTDIPIDYYTNYRTYLLMSILESWMKNFTESPKEVCEIVGKMLNTTYH